MQSILILLLLGAQSKMLVRLYEPPHTVAQMDIAGCKRGEWVDVVVTQEELSKLRGKNIQVLIEDIDEFGQSVKGFYHSYPGFVDTFTQIALNHPSIAKLDTIGVSWEGREILAMKISDNVYIDEDEPELLFDGLHHAREWPALEIPLFYADTLTKAYGIDAHITEVVNSNEIWIVPCVNPDGYAYSYDQGYPWWRKNRRPPEGVDPNRNYAGSCDSVPEGAWGGEGASHDPSSDVYCGEAPFSEYETQAIRDLIVANSFTFYITYHTYGEMVMWPWGYTGSGTPDSTLLSDVGYNMAQQIEIQGGGGAYDAFQCYYLYPTTGTSKEWAYGYERYVQGSPILAYAVEACNEFHPWPTVLDQVVKENFDGAIYLCDIVDSVRMIIPPVIAKLDPSTGDYEINWTTRPADKYWLEELSSFSAINDGAEAPSELWILDGFTRTSTQSHSGSYSYSAIPLTNKISLMTTKSPLPIPDSLVFWCMYDIADTLHRAFLEVSRNQTKWKKLDSYTGNSGGWVKKSYSLPGYNSLFIRFRYVPNNSKSGFYVDDIYPVPWFDSVTTVSDSIADTFYVMTGKPPNTYWYRVKGHNLRGWGYSSELEDIVVEVGVSEDEVVNSFMFVSTQNPCAKEIDVLYSLPKQCAVSLKIYDAGGRLVKTVKNHNKESTGRHRSRISLDFLSSGIYFIIFRAGNFKKSLKITLIH